MQPTRDPKRVAAEAARGLGVPVPAVQVADGLVATHRDETVVIGSEWATVPDEVFSDSGYRALLTLLVSRASVVGSADDGRWTTGCFLAVFVVLLVLGLLGGVPALPLVAVNTLLGYAVTVALLSRRTRRRYYAADAAVLDLLGERAALDACIATHQTTKPWSPIPGDARRAAHIAARARRQGLPEDSVVKEVAEAYLDRQRSG